MADYDPKLLRRARALSGLSLRELSSRAGVHITSLTRFENGLTPSDESWDKLEAALRDALDEAATAIVATRRLLRKRPMPENVKRRRGV